jgi:hypothetical protein
LSDAGTFDSLSISVVAQCSGQSSRVDPHKYRSSVQSACFPDAVSDEDATADVDASADVDAAADTDADTSDDADAAADTDADTAVAADAAEDAAAADSDAAVAADAAAAAPVSVALLSEAFEAATVEAAAAAVDAGASFTGCLAEAQPTRHVRDSKTTAVFQNPFLRFIFPPVENL